MANLKVEAGKKDFIRQRRYQHACGNRLEGGKFTEAELTHRAAEGWPVAHHNKGTRRRYFSYSPSLLCLLLAPSLHCCAIWPLWAFSLIEAWLRSESKDNGSAYMLLQAGVFRPCSMGQASPRAEHWDHLSVLELG